MDSKCAPDREFKEGSCLKDNEVNKIIHAYNNENPDDIIQIENNKEKNIKKLNNKFNSKYGCSSQICWLQKDFVKNEFDDDELDKKTFRPRGPDKKHDWLSTTHINEVIEQYEKLHPEFLFLGAVPYDFEILSGLSIGTLNYADLESNGIHKLGMVINLDEHNQPGSHWVALYIDLQENKIYFFDSVGKKPGKRIRQYITKVTKYLYEKKYGHKLDVHKMKKSENNKYFKNTNGFDLKYNHKQHQFKNSECGVYSINFILRLLKGETFNDIIENITDDDTMNECRKTYFRN